MTLRQYYAQSRTAMYSVLFAAPLLVAYEVAAWVMSSPAGGGVRNGADVLLKTPFVRLAGWRGLVLFDLLLLTWAVTLVIRDRRRRHGTLQPGVFAGMLGESLTLAVLVGLVLRYVTATVLHYFVLSRPSSLDTPHQLMISLGAGIYEEILFRVLLVGGLTLLGRRLLGWTPRVAATVAVLVSAAVFSSFHYIGAYGEQWQLASFLFRFFAGLIFSALYVWRGFGITSWTHALYDVLVTVAAI